MKIFKVGGCVRDHILGIPSKDTDYVVVGSTVEEMISLGYSQVGADFPVFLHPVTNDEYALARTERKSGQGYHGFVVDASSTVTLEDDLFRRDLTINAIAQDDDGVIVDPFGGVEDIRSKVLRHVSDHFRDDPVRVLRLARFAAKFSDFRIADETIFLCRKMVADGEIDHLTAERISLELTKAFATGEPSRFFESLGRFNALNVLFPELAQMDQVGYSVTLSMLDEAAARGASVEALFAILCHAFPSVHGVCGRLKLPSDFKRIASFVNCYHDRLDINDVGLLQEMFIAGGKNRTDTHEALALVNELTGKGGSETYLLIMEQLGNVKLSNDFTPEQIKTMTVPEIRAHLDSREKEAITDILGGKYTRFEIGQIRESKKAAHVEMREFLGRRGVRIDPDIEALQSR